VLRRPLTASFSSTQIVLVEHCILTLILFPVWWRACRGLSRSEWAAVLGIAWGGSAIASVCFTEAIRTGNPTTAVLLQKTQPIFAILLAKIALRERLLPRLWIGLAVALFATYLVSFGAIPPAVLLRHPSRAAPLALAAAALWGGSTVLGRFALRNIAFVSLTALRIVMAAPLLALMTWLRPHPWPEFAAKPALSLVALALIPGLAALLIYYRGLRQTPASRAAVAELSFPATAALLNWTLLGASVSPAQIAGFALLWAAIVGM
jgi:drug/metabolite transporter (DMT)-like permease